MEYIDPHTHIYDLDWDDLELLAISGMKAVVAPIGRPAVFIRKGGRRLTVQDMVDFWDQCLRRGEMIERTFYFRVFFAITFGSNTSLDRFDEAAKAMREYLRRENVVAVGEIGLDPWDWAGRDMLSLDESKKVTKLQFQMAKDLGLPVIIHTTELRSAAHYMEQPTLPKWCPPWPFKKHFAVETLALAEEVGFPQEKLVVDHADEELVQYVLSETEANVAISGCKHWRKMPYYAAAEIVHRYGPERVMLSADAIGRVPMEPLWIAKAMRELKRLGMPEESIRQVVHDNPIAVFGLHL